VSPNAGETVNHHSSDIARTVVLPTSPTRLADGLELGSALSSLLLEFAPLKNAAKFFGWFPRSFISVKD